MCFFHSFIILRGVCDCLERSNFVVKCLLKPNLLAVNLDAHNVENQIASLLFVVDVVVRATAAKNVSKNIGNSTNHIIRFVFSLSLCAFVISFLSKLSRSGNGNPLDVEGSYEITAK